MFGFDVSGSWFYFMTEFLAVKEGKTCRSKRLSELHHAFPLIQRCWCECDQTTCKLESKETELKFCKALKLFYQRKQQNSYLLFVCLILWVSFLVYFGYLMCAVSSRFSYQYHLIYAQSWLQSFTSEVFGSIYFSLLQCHLIIFAFRICSKAVFYLDQTYRPETFSPF